MPRVSYVNGHYVRHAEAAIHIEDRGFQFADAVYEVMPVAAGRVRHLDQHLDRLERSLGALAIAWPVPRRVLPLILAEVVRRNRLADGVVYLQATRGAAPRNHLFPAAAMPGLVVSAWAAKGPSARQVEEGVAVATRPDQRWKRPDIKTVALLPNALARQSAKEVGAFEALLIGEAGQVREGSATNFFIIGRDGALLTHPADHAILAGVTRANVVSQARSMGLEIGERPFGLDEVSAAREAFLTGTTIAVLPVTRIDGRPVADGTPGPVTLALRSRVLELRNR